MAKMAIFFKSYGQMKIPYSYWCFKLFGRQRFFAKEACFYPKTAISAVNLKLPVTTCLYLS